MLGLTGFVAIKEAAALSPPNYEMDPSDLDTRVLPQKKVDGEQTEQNGCEREVCPTATAVEATLEATAPLPPKEISSSELELGTSKPQKRGSGEQTEQNGFELNSHANDNTGEVQQPIQENGHSKEAPAVQKGQANQGSGKNKRRRKGAKRKGEAGGEADVEADVEVSELMGGKAGTQTSGKANAVNGTSGCEVLNAGRRGKFNGKLKAKAEKGETLRRTLWVPKGVADQADRTDRRSFRTQLQATRERVQGR